MDSAQRVEKLKAFLRDDPDNAFILYALAMEMASEGDTDRSLVYFDRLLQADPKYVPGYLQKGSLLARLGDYIEARKTLKTGIPLAQKQALLHARDRMQEMLDRLPKDRR